MTAWCRAVQTSLRACASVSQTSRHWGTTAEQQTRGVVCHLCHRTGRSTTDIVARQKECRILEGHVMPDHVHRCIEIPPQHAVASVIGFLKGKSAIAIARQCSGRERNFTGEHCWARGYAVSAVGCELEQVRASIRDQEQADEQGRF